MITSIHKIESTPGSGRISFRVTVDAAGADEVVSTMINGRRYATHVNLKQGGIHQLSIAHVETGRHTVRLYAESSDIASNPTDVWG
jgi:hypothetical protein